MRIAFQILMIGLVGSVLGIVANRFSPHPARLSEPVYAAAESGAGSCNAGGGKMPRIEVLEATALCTACTAAFVDARSAAAYEEGHVPNAVHLPPVGHHDEEAALKKLREYASVVVYDGESSCTLAEQVAHRLQGRGLHNVRVLTGGWPAWNSSASELGESGACQICADHGKGH